MTKKELITKFEELKNKNKSCMNVAFETGDYKAASYFYGFVWGMEVAKTMLERSSLK